MSLTNEEFFKIVKMTINKWAELACKEIDDDIKLAKDELDLYYLRALISKRVDALMNIHTEFEKSNDDRVKLELIDEFYGEQLGVPATQLKIDVDKRLDWLKRRKGKDFEREIKNIINFHNITSPIEQIFLMEWKFGGLNEKLGVEISPQKQVASHDKKYIVDFIIKSVKPGIPQISIVVELDGYDFHEKTRGQVAHDKKKDRTLTRMGMPVLRFSGYEIVYKTQACINETADFIREITMQP